MVTKDITSDQIFGDTPLNFTGGNVDVLDFYNNQIVSKVNNVERILGLANAQDVDILSQTEGLGNDANSDFTATSEGYESTAKPYASTLDSAMELRSVIDDRSNIQP